MMIKETLTTFILILCFVNSIAQNIQIMTYNIRYNTEKDGINKWDNRKDKAAQMVKYYEVDFCGMQEALLGQIIDLQQRLPDYEHFGVGRDDGKDKGEFSPIFYRKNKFKLLQQQTFWLSETPDIPSKGWDASLPRIATWGYFKDLKSKKRFYVFNTHYDHLGPIARRESTKLILKKIKEIAGTKKVILMGDFNATTTERPIMELMEHMHESSTLSILPHFGPESSFNGFETKEQDNRRIDFIFLNDPKIKVFKHATLSNTWAGLFASDHHPVLTEIKF